MRASFVLAVLLASLSPAWASRDSDWRLCLESRASLEAAQQACTRLLADPAMSGADQARTLLGRGSILILRQQPTAALADLDRATLLKADDALAHLRRGLVLTQLGRFDEAHKAIDAAMRLKPDWPNAHNNRGSIHAAQGNLDKAIVEFQTAIRLGPETPLPYVNLGDALERKGRRAEAIALLEQALAKPPRRDNADDERARRVATEGLKRLRGPDAPKSSAADRADCSKRRDDAGLAACGRIIADAAASAEEKVTAHMARSGLQYDRRQYEAVIAELDQLLHIKPDHVMALNRRGLAKQELNRNSDAVADFDKALSLDPSFVIAYNNRGNSHRGRGEYDKAMADYAEAMRRAPGYLHPLRNRGYAFERMGLFAEAEQAYRQVTVASPRPGQNDDARAKREAALDLKRLAAIQQARARVGSTIGTRAALLIGNTRYTGSLEALATPSNDVRALAAALGRLGFRNEDIIERHDLDRRGMVTALREFEAKARNVDWAFVFFAGHGVRARSNLDYLIPVDAHISSESDLPDEGIALERVVERISGARRLQMVVFDACRSNELSRRLYASGEVLRSAATTNPPFEAPGLVLAFSARRGQSALDGQQHSPFAEALLAQLERPGVDLETVLASTAEQVRKATREAQSPEIFGLGYGKGLVMR